MSISKYYRFAIWLPILLPVIALPAYFWLYNNDLGKVFFPLSEFSFAGIILFLVGSLLWGGVSYLLTLALNYKTLASDDVRAQRRMMWTLPLRMVPVLCVCVFLLFFIYSGEGIKFFGSLGFIELVLAYISVATLVFGYLYVFLVQGVFWFLKSREFISEPATPELRTLHSRFSKESGRR